MLRYYFGVVIVVFIMGAFSANADCGDEYMLRHHSRAGRTDICGFEWPSYFRVLTNWGTKPEWIDDHRLVLVTGNAEINPTEKNAEEYILSVYQASKKVPVEPLADIEKITFPYLPIPEKKGEIDKRKDIEDLGITIIEFKNGVQLNMKKTDYKADEVLFNVAFGNGRLDEPEHAPGLSMIGEETINESGFGKLTKKCVFL